MKLSKLLTVTGLTAVAFILFAPVSALAQSCTARSVATLMSELPDNTSGAITPADLRDVACSSPNLQNNLSDLLSASTARSNLGANNAANLTTGDLAAARFTTNFSAAIDSAIGSTRGSVLYRGASGWAILAPGTNGWFLKTLGAGADPAWAAASGGSGCSTSGASILYGDGAGGCSNVTIDGSLKFTGGVLSTAAAVVAGTTQTVTTGQWAGGTQFQVTTAGQTITIPHSTTLSTNGGVTIQTIGHTVTVALGNSGDAINGGTAGASVTIDAGLTSTVTTDGAGNFYASPVTAGGSGPSAANPSATASDTANNGSASTFMRSDASPAVQKGSSSQFGVMKCDNSTITCSGGVLVATGGGGGGGGIAFSANPTAPTGTTSTSPKMMGLGTTCKFTPSGSGNVLINVSGLLVNSAGTDGGYGTLYYGTGTAPSNGASVTGTNTNVIGGAGTVVSNGGALTFGVTWVAVGLTPSTAYWFDVALQENGVGGGAVASISSLGCSALEN